MPFLRRNPHGRPLAIHAGQPHQGGVENGLLLLWETFFELLTMWPTPSFLDGVGHVNVTTYH